MRYVLVAASILLVCNLVPAQETLDQRTAKLELELAKVKLQVAALVNNSSTITERTVTELPVIPLYSMRPGYTLHLLYGKDCTWCPNAKEAVVNSGVPVIETDIYESPFRAVELWQGSIKDFAIPAWVLCYNDTPVARWTGTRTASEVKEMASYVPRQKAEIAMSYSSTIAATTTAPIKAYYAEPLPAPVQYAQPQYTHRSIPPARQRWSYSGSNLAAHLAQTHGINPAGMSHSDMVNAHSHAHEGTWSGAYQQQSQPQYYSRPAKTYYARQPVRNVFRSVLGLGGCPSGACPF